MALTVAEVMNRELMSLRAEHPVDYALTAIVAMGVSAAPVVDGRGALCGIVSWRDLVGSRSEVVRTFIVLTTEPDELSVPIHNQMSVIFGREDWPAWLGDVDVPQKGLLGMLCSYPATIMCAYRVDWLVRNVRKTILVCSPR